MFPITKLSVFDPTELELLIGGIDKVRVVYPSALFSAAMLLHERERERERERGREGENVGKEGIVRVGERVRASAAGGQMRFLHAAARNGLPNHGMVLRDLLWALMLLRLPVWLAGHCRLIQRTGGRTLRSMDTPRSRSLWFCKHQSPGPVAAAPHVRQLDKPCRQSGWTVGTLTRRQKSCLVGSPCKLTAFGSLYTPWTTR